MPDKAALIFLLTNLAPDKWQNKQKLSGEVGSGLNIIVENKEDAELIKILAEK